MDPPRRLAHPLQDGLGLHQEHLSRRGQRHRPGAPVEEGTAQGGFQLADLLGDGGLGDVELLRRLGEAAGLGGGDKVFQLVLVHKEPPRLRKWRNGILCMMYRILESVPAPKTTVQRLFHREIGRFPRIITFSYLIIPKSPL